MGKDLVKGQLQKVLGLEFFSHRYEFISLLGTGAFGLVIQVFSKELKQELALKVIAIAGSRSKLEKWAKSELIIQSKLSHPHIVLLKGYRRSEEYFFLELELIRGGNMLQFMRTPPPEEMVSGLIKQTVDALEYLHWKGIVHRDIKPENILIEDHGHKKQVKLGDFGISGVAHPLFHEGFRAECGTEAYKAPEQLARSVYGKAVDMWSLGVLTFMLLQSGRHPFPRGEKSTAEYLVWLKNQSLEWDEDGPSEMARDFVSRLLRFDEFDRYAAYEAKKHPWISNPSNPIPLKFCQKVNIAEAHQALKNTLVGLAIIHLSKKATLEQLEVQKAMISPRLQDFSSTFFLTEHEAPIFRTQPSVTSKPPQPEKRPRLALKQRQDLNSTLGTSTSNRVLDSYSSKPPKPNVRGSRGPGDILKNIHQILQKLESLNEPDRSVAGLRTKSLTRPDRNQNIHRRSSISSLSNVLDQPGQKVEPEESIQPAFRLKRGAKLTMSFRPFADKTGLPHVPQQPHILNPPQPAPQGQSDVLGYTIKPSIMKRTLRRTSSIFENKENNPFEAVKNGRFGGLKQSRLTLATSKTNLPKPVPKILQEHHN